MVHTTSKICILSGRSEVAVLLASTAAGDIHASLQEPNEAVVLLGAFVTPMTEQFVSWCCDVDTTTSTGIPVSVEESREVAVHLGSELGGKSVKGI